MLCTVSHCTALYRTSPYSSQLYPTIFSYSRIHCTYCTEVHYMNNSALLHTPHHTELQCTTLDHTALHWTTLHWTTLHLITLHYTTLHYTTLDHTAFDHTILHLTTLLYPTVDHTACRAINTSLQPTHWLGIYTSDFALIPRVRQVIHHMDKTRTGHTPHG